MDEWMRGSLDVCVCGWCVEPLAWINLPQALFVCSFLLSCCCCWLGGRGDEWVDG